MKPSYLPSMFSSTSLEQVLSSTPWVQVTDARLECFMSDSDKTYTYGSGRGIRTYTPVRFSCLVEDIQFKLNTAAWPRSLYQFNVCFLNRYDNAQMHLGWHADDSPGMDHEHPIAVVSFGQPREIWWREIGYKGVIPSSQRIVLGHGSLFVMPAGFQKLYQHRIPKGDREMGPRASMTFRHYVP